MDTAASTRDKLQKVREQINKKSKQIQLFTESGIDTIPTTDDWQPFKNILIKTILEDFDQDTVLLTKGSKGSILEKHHHISIEVVYVLTGRVSENCSNTILSKGGVITIPAGVNHEFEFIEDSTILVHWID